MAADISLGTKVAESLNAAIVPKVELVGWSSGPEATALSEYIVLMVVNGKTKDQIATELAVDLLNLEANDPGVQDFVGWLFAEIESLSKQGEQDGGVKTEDNEDVTIVTDALDLDTDMGTVGDAAELNAPTGPRSMRAPRGGREKRMFGHMNKAMDRSSDSVLHRVRGQTGNERVNSHGRGAPTGPRGNGIRGGRHASNRAANIEAGLAGMPGMNGMNNFMMPQGDLYAILEQQSLMMQQLSQQMMAGNGGAGGSQQRPGRSLFDRVNASQRGNSRRGHHSGPRPDNGKQPALADGEDVDMDQGKREPANPDESVCKFNQNCTNKECKFAHASPAAAPGTIIDLHDTCSFGVACKNRKCVGKHPSPANRIAHQSEQDCKFFPNCQNPRCSFRHPAMPPCRNGGECSVPNCKFTHVKTKCKYNPCLNQQCPFAHEEGQRGAYKDKVWTADGAKEHPSERKFVDESAHEEMIIPGQGNDGVQEVVV